MYDLFDFAGFCVIFLLGIFGLIAVLSVPANLVNRYSCQQYESVTGRDTRFAWYSGCYILMEDGRFEEYDIYTQRMIAKEGLSASKGTGL